MSLYCNVSFPVRALAVLLLRSNFGISRNDVISRLEQVGSLADSSVDWRILHHQHNVD